LTGLNQSFGKGENSSINKSFQGVVSQVKKFATDNKISDSSAFQILLGGGISASTGLTNTLKGGGIGSLGFGLNASASANHQTSGTNTR